MGLVLLDGVLEVLKLRQQCSVRYITFLVLIMNVDSIQNTNDYLFSMAMVLVDGISNVVCYDTCSL
jgi:hypothetical protein